MRKRDIEKLLSIAEEIRTIGPRLLKDMEYAHSGCNYPCPPEALIDCAVARANRLHDITASFIGTVYKAREHK